jgi:hypothetical protein
MLEDRLMQQSKNSDCEVWFELDWITNEHTPVRPDIMIVCGSFTGDYLQLSRALIVKVASSQTRMAVCNVQFGQYVENGVAYYILADPKGK